MIKSLLSSATAKDTSFLIVGSIISVLIGIILLPLLSRTISQTEVGLFITASTISQLLADIFELGINPAALTFISQNNQLKNKIIQQSFFLKLILAVLVILLIFLFASPLAFYFFHNQRMEQYLKISSLGAVFLLLIAWAQNIFQAERRFLAASILNTSTNIFRFLILTLALLIGVSDGLSLYFLFQAVLIFSFIFFASPILKRVLHISKDTSQVKPMLKFGLPIGLGFGLAAIYSRLDQIFVFSLAGEKEAAVYGIASRLMMIAVFVIAAFNSAIIVRFASLEKEQFKIYFQKTWQIIFGIIGVVLLGAAIAPILLPLIFGPSYTPSVRPFQILTLGIIFFILSVPFNNAILYHHKKRIFPLLLSITSLILTYFLLQALIPLYQSLGAAIAMSIVYFIQFIISIMYYFKVKDD